MKDLYKAFYKSDKNISEYSSVQWKGGGGIAQGIGGNFENGLIFDGDTR